MFMSTEHSPRGQISGRADNFTKAFTVHTPVVKLVNLHDTPLMKATDSWRDGKGEGKGEERIREGGIKEGVRVGPREERVACRI